MRAPRAGGVLTVLAAATLAMLGFTGFAFTPSAAFAQPLPIRVDTRASLSGQFGYRPGYELNIPSFDPWNRPAIRSRTPF